MCLSLDDPSRQRPSAPSGVIRERWRKARLSAQRFGVAAINVRRVGLEADAVAVAAGELSVVRTANALDVVEASQGRPVPLAAYRAGDYCVVLFVIKRSDGWWQTEVVPVRAGDVESYGGGAGGIVRRSDVKAGEPFVEGEGRTELDDGQELVQVDGVSADEIVRMRLGDQVVSEAAVAPHGFFVLAAILPADAQVTVEAASTRLG